MKSGNRSDAYDVVVIGYGGAGAAAAIEAAEAGASVLVVEKYTEGGGTTKMAAGNIRQVRDAGKMADHIEALTDGTTDRQSIDVHVQGLVDLPNWIDRLGGVIATDPSEELEAKKEPGPPYPGANPGTIFTGVVGAEGIGLRYRWPKQNGLSRGKAAWGMLSGNVEKLGAEILTRTAVQRLIRDDDRITGIVAEQAGQQLQITARKGVVLACGGFAWDADLLRNYLGISIPAAGPPGRNAGDGVRMAQAVGASLWHMNGFVLSMGMLVPGYEATFAMKIRERGFIMVDRGAERFCDESKLAGHSGYLLVEDRDHKSALWKRIPSFAIFDEATRLAGPITTPEAGWNLDAGWSDDNSQPIDKGWIQAAPTIEGLAAKLGLDPGALRKTIDAYNRGVDSSADAMGRAAGDLRHIVDGPFYGVAIWPTIYNTQGGPRRNARGEILDPFGAPIAGLYGAGELGSIFNTLYPGGMNYGEAFVSGRWAGASAVGAQPK